MVELSCDHVSFAFGTDVILQDVTFSINEGDKLGIVGVNGAGKSTLLKLITGEYDTQSGNIFYSRQKSLGWLAQHVEFESEASVYDEMLHAYDALLTMEKELAALRTQMENHPSEELAHRFSLLHDKFTADGGYEFRSRCRGILLHLGFDDRFLQLPVSALSGGQKTKLALARLLMQAPDILILDEPTNHLDLDAVTWLEDFLATYHKTILLISHDRYFLDRITNKILEIENTRARLYNGNYSAYVEKKRTDREIQQRHYENQQREIARIEAYIAQQRRWNRERNIIAAESRQKQLDKMERMERPEALPEDIRLQFRSGVESGNEVLDVRGLGKSYPGKKLFEALSFTLRKHDRLFITGENGCGKSTLLQILAGKTDADAGIFDYGYHVQLGYYDQENQNLHPEKTVLDELWDAFPTLSQTEIRNQLALLLFRGDDIQKKVASLSGGEKARLTFAKLMLTETNLLILDEPTNHLDLASKELLEQALLAYPGTLIAVSHDRYFVKKLATRILDFHGKDRYRCFDYAGGYESYLAYRKNLAAQPSKEPEISESASGGKDQYLEAKRKNAEQKKRERRLQFLESEIEKAEQLLANLEREMEEQASDYEAVAKCFAQKQQTEQQLDAWYAELDTLDT